jgi:DNA (cytosine-5)-methyltransferase 1
MPTSEVLADAEDVGRQRSRRARDGWDGPPHRRPTFGSLFAGIGGIDLGLERAGWDCRFQVEWDPFCQRVLAKHWPDVPRFGDITAVDWSAVEPVDLLAGGFPCQPFSVAGKQRRLEDDRWLWPEFARTIRELRPRFVLVENVPGLLVGGGMGAVLGDLAELGFDASWESIPAAAVGAPHLRYRVWIIAHRQGDASRPDADGVGSHRADVDIDGSPELRDEQVCEPGSLGQPLADPDLAGPQGHRGLDPERDGPGERPAWPSGGALDDWWSVEPDVGRVAHGVPARVDRLRSLGNAVVPQIVEVIGRQLLASIEAVA